MQPASYARESLQINRIESALNFIEVFFDVGFIFVSFTLIRSNSCCFFFDQIAYRTVEILVRPTDVTMDPRQKENSFLLFLFSKAQTQM